MPYEPGAIVEAHQAGAARYPNGRPLAPDAAVAWAAVQRPSPAPLGAALVRDSARREWRVEARRDPARGRLLVFAPAHGDQEPFRASADGHRPDTHLAVTGVEWALLALLATGRAGDAGRDDAELRGAAFVVVDRLVRAAQHRLLMGAAEDDEDDG
jgi:hypothetical protein